MDVRCERCKTEYEFDDARINEAGVTVKCTTCGHVFKVKKKALVVTVPVKPGELEPTTPLASAAVIAASSDKPREWKVRQANGNVFTFKELTTLQKWIVERKVVRDDEISLTGDTWKRLGNIADLASFFQVVEDAEKGAQLSALHILGVAGAVMTPPGGYPALGSAAPPAAAQQPAPAVVTHFLGSTPAQQPPIALTAPVPQGSGPAAAAPAPVAAPQAPPAPPQVAQPVVAAPSSPAVVVVSTAPAMPQPVVLAAPAPHEPAPAAPEKKGGLGWVWVLLLALAALGGGGYYGYAYWWIPMQRSAAQAVEAARQAEAARQESARIQQEQRDAEEARKADEARQAEEARKAEEARLAAAAAALDAGAQAAAAEVDAGTTVAVSEKPKREPAHDFDWYMTQGDRQRERDRAEAALDAYGKAADLQPQRAEPLAGRGLALSDMGLRLQAEAAFQQSLKLNPRYGVAIMGLAEVYRQEGKKDQALAYYQKYLDVLPNGPEAAVAKSAIERLGR